MEEGTVYLPASATIVKGARNMDNAKLFMDFILSEEVQNIWGSTLTNRPIQTSNLADRERLIGGWRCSSVGECLPSMQESTNKQTDRTKETLFPSRLCTSEVCSLS